MKTPDDLDVEVVRARVADFPDLDRFRGMLSENEAARARAYKVDEPRAVFTLARGLLRFELAKRLGKNPRDIHLDLRPSGKPDLRRLNDVAPDWRFSVSHTGPHVAIAFALDVDVGIDLERVDRVVPPLDIARRYFAPSELRALEALEPQAQTRAFLAGWTRKEAIVKARGETMAESLTTLTVDLDPSLLHPRSRDTDSVSRRASCRLTSFEFPDQNLIGAVALQGDMEPRLNFRVVSGGTFD